MTRTTIEGQRITALEETIAHQAKTIEELSGEVARQWDTIRALQKKVDALTERFLALEEVATPPAESRRPPHW
ncbi:MAG: SlyX family protein [Nitratireductor sp.]|nr:SlyX family protein [Nitratireductor sp.]